MTPLILGELPNPPGVPASHLHVFGRNVLLKNLGESSRLFQMCFFMVVARRFGPVGLGKLTVLMMVGSAIGLFFGDFGINTNVIAKLSVRQPALDFASEAFQWKMVLSLTSFILMCGAMYLTRSSTSWVEILAVALISTGAVAIEFLSAILNGINRFDSEAWLRIIYRGTVFGTAGLVAFKSSLSADLVYMAFVTGLVVIAAFIFLRFRLVRLSPNSKWGLSGNLLKESMPVWVTQLAQMTYLKFDVVILGLLHVAALQIGWYAAAWKIVDVLTVVPAILAISALPLLSAANASGTTREIAPQYLKVISVLPFVVVLPLAIGADGITRLLYGPGFMGAPGILRVLLWALVPIFMHTFLAVLAVATRRQLVAAKLAATASVLGILAAIGLVPHFGYGTMAIICLVANLLFALAMIFEFRDVTGVAIYSVALKSLGSAVGIYAACMLLVTRVPSLLLAISGLAVYGVALLALGIVNSAQLRRMKELAGILLWSRFAGEVRTL